MNAFSASQLSKDSTLATYTSSLETRMSAIATETASLETRASSLATLTGSLISSASADRVSLTNIQSLTASVLTQLQSLGTETASLETRATTLASYTSSLETRMSSLATISGSLISTASSNVQRLSDIENYTSSLKAAFTASGRNVTFSNDITVQGNLTVKGTTTSVESSIVNIGDNIINLNGSAVANGGIYVADPTAPTTGTGSMLWDSTNNYWKAGFSGSESKVLLAGGDSVVSGSSQITVSDTTGFSTYSSSVATSLSNINTSISASGIWFATGSTFSTTNNLEVTGSLRVSGSINAANINAGTPSSNAWGSGLNGSYFNNFTSQTNVSEILRFVAGLLSSSAPDVSPNTRTLGSVTTNGLNTSSGTVTAGSIPQSATNTTITYLNSKGFATAGSTIFNGVGTIYTSNLGYSYTSVASGTTTATSSADSQLFGLGNLTNGAVSPFYLSGSFTFRFMDNSSKTQTATSSSALLISASSAASASGMTLALINTVNPAVIPPAYQDGKFAAALPQYLYSGSATAVSASGYYHISGSFRIASGSSPVYSSTLSANGSEIFWAPLTTISTNVPANTISTTYTSGSLTAVSRSLSGAPYLSQSTYYVSGSTTGLFNPLYHAGANLAYHSLSGTGMTQTSGITTVTTAGGTIGTANAVYDSTGTTVRATGTIPYETDIVRTNGLYTFGSANITNVGQTTQSPTTFAVSLNANNKNSSASTYATSTAQYHSAGTFGQPASSGSLAYFTRTQGSDSSTALAEVFTGENYRIQLGDNVLTFSGSAWTTTFGLYNLTGNDLQVKPGYLVKPGGTYGYWLGDPDATKTYKYYIRKITTSGTKTSMTLNLGTTLVNWAATTNNSVAAVVLFESSNSNIYAKARVYDPSDLTSNFIATQTANTDGMNPFGSNIDLYGNTGGSLATNTYTIPLRNADGMIMNATYTNAYVIVRYKGDPTPITGITATFS